MRAMRLWTDAANTTTLASTDTANFYDAVGANFVLELRVISLPLVFISRGGQRAA